MQTTTQSKTENCKPADHVYQWAGIVDGVEYFQCKNCPHYRSQFHDCGSGC